MITVAKKRRPKSKNYFTKDTENAIVAFFKHQHVSLLPVSAFTNHGISSLIKLILTMSQES